MHLYTNCMFYKILLSCWSFPNAGSPIYPSPYRLVDVRDVAHAHIQALEVPMANGRYMMVGRVTHDNEIVNFLCQNYPAMHLPGKYVTVILILNAVSNYIRKFLNGFLSLDLKITSMSQHTMFLRREQKVWALTSCLGSWVLRTLLKAWRRRASSISSNSSKGEAIRYFCTSLFGVSVVVKSYVASTNELFWLNFGLKGSNLRSILLQFYSCILIEQSPTCYFLNWNTTKTN